MRTTTGAGGKKYGPIGYLRRHSTPREVSRDACRVRWSGVAINATNRFHHCVFPPLSYWIHGGRRWRTGWASGSYSSRRPRGWSACILYGRYGHIGRRSLPYKLYGVFRHMFCMAKHLHISKSGQGVANLLWYVRVRVGRDSTES